MLLSSPFQKKLKALLVKRLMAIITPLQKLQADKTGLNALATKKLVSDSYVYEFLAAEQSLNQEIEYCFMEAELLEQGWSKTIFEQAINFWRINLVKQGVAKTQ